MIRLEAHFFKQLPGSLFPSRCIVVQAVDLHDFCNGIADAQSGIKRRIGILEDHLNAFAECFQFFSFQDDVQNMYQSLEGLALPEHLEVLDGVKVVWKKDHALLEEYAF